MKQEGYRMAKAMTLTSTAFEQGKKIPRKYTCQGEEINPPLHIAGTPDKAKSLVLIIDDPDVPEYIRSDRMWVHWVVFNIPPTMTDIAEKASSFGTAGKNTSGSLVYQGPCPPDREHRYFFKIYALDTLLKLSEGATKHEVEKAMEGHIIGRGELMGLYEKTAT